MHKITEKYIIENRYQTKQNTKPKTNPNKKV